MTGGSGHSCQSGRNDRKRPIAAVRPSPDSRRDAESAEGKRENLCVLCVSARNVWKAASERLRTFLSPSSSEEGGVGSVGPPDRPEQSGGLFTRRRWWRAIARKTSSTTPLRLGREAPKSRCPSSEEEGSSQCLKPTPVRTVTRSLAPPSPRETRTLPRGRVRAARGRRGRPSARAARGRRQDRKSTRLNSSH